METNSNDELLQRRAGPKTMNLITGLVIPIAPDLVRLTGSYTSAAVLRQMIYLSTSAEADEEGWFCMSHEDWLTDYNLTEDEIRGALDGGKKTVALTSIGVERCKRKEKRGSWTSTGPKAHYRVNFNTLEQAITEFVDRKNGSTEIPSNLVARKKPATSLYSKKNENSAATRTPAQLASDRIQAFAAVMAAYHHEWQYDWRDPQNTEGGYKAWSDLFRRAVQNWRGTGSNGTAGQIAKQYQELTPEQFEEFLRDYETNNAELPRLSQVDTVRHRLDTWLSEDVVDSDIQIRKANPLDDLD